jgi:hypothetical protein
VCGSIKRVQKWRAKGSFGQPEGDVMDDISVSHIDDDAIGVPAERLSEEDLDRELAHLHETRHETFLHGPTAALQHHSERTAELELEYLRRHPERDVDERRINHPA